MEWDNLIAAIGGVCAVLFAQHIEDRQQHPLQYRCSVKGCKYVVKTNDQSIYESFVKSHTHSEKDI